MQRGLAAHDAPQDPPAIATEGGQSFRVVRVHKSLGTHLTDNGSWGPEVAARIAAMRSGIGPIRRTFAKCREGPRTKSKLTYADALGMSKLTFNCGIWGPLGSRAAAALNKAYHSVYRAIEPRGESNQDGPKFETTNETLLANAQRPHPDQYLALARLRYLPRLLRRAPQSLLAALDVLYRCAYGGGSCLA